MNQQQLIDLAKEFWAALSEPLFEISGNKLSVMTFITAVILFVVFIKGAHVVERFLRKFLQDKPIDQGIKNSLARFGRYITIVIGAIITLETIGVSLSSLAALGAVLMVGIGFGLQNIAQNFISGLIILLERPIKEGDIVQVGGVSGRVIDIQARSTLIQTRNDVSILVPNSQFISEQVINESFSGHQIRYSVSVGVAYGSDTKLVKETLLAVAAANPKVLKNPGPDVLFTNFGDSSLDFELRVWLEDLWSYIIVLSELRFAIDEQFREKQITIPFPQRDLHVVSSNVKFQ
ncbi:MAG: mechanosensitive ion channel family protein [bacterium]